MSPALTTSLDTQIARCLHDHDVRYTSGRQKVVATLHGADGPLSAGELGSLLTPQVPVSSIYRTLAVLTETGVVTPHLSTKGLARYELAEWLTGHHHHLVCVECGSVEDVDVPESEEDKVRSLVGSIAASASFTPTNHALEIEGRCARCL
jgi:Fe2+ or Zn2+ uptake regulation protein